ncbi:MAG: carbohydrate-binding family 9-like protein [Planctomycetales bacterium]
MKYLIVGLIVVSFLRVPQESLADDKLQVATFSADITPPLGQPVGLGFIPILKTAEHPLLARGILLKDSGVSCVICTLDWMEVHNESYDFLREAIGKAAGVPASNVALQSLHQHTAPAISTAALRLQLEETSPRRIATAEYLLDVAKKIAAAIRDSQENWQNVTSIGTGKAKVERVASNRRLERADGSIQGRSSNTKKSPALRELDEGLIDPWVRTVSFESSDDAIAQLHYYASHPQSFYGDGRATYDVPGMIRERLETNGGAFQVYVTGCGGDVAYGKYNNGSLEARTELTARLQSGIEQSIASLTQHPVKPMQWSVEPVRFPFRTDDAYSESASRSILRDPKASEAQTRKAAIALAWIERARSRRPVELSCLSIGEVQMLHLPGEPFVQFQLAAQKMRPDHFVCVAGYGDCGMGYIGGDRIFTDRGGYEQTYSFAGPCEELFLSSIRKVLTATSGTNEEDLPRYTAHRAGSKITIDGKLDELAWRNATSFGDFQFPWWEAGKKEQTTARMLWDDEFLFVSYDCKDAHISSVNTEHDSPVYKDDCVELFTSPNPDRPFDYFNIEMNVNRAILDRHHPDGPGRKVPNWNSKGIVIATSVNGTLNDDSDKDRGWILEVAIPFANFAEVTGRPHPNDGDVWHLNLNRLGGETNPQHSQWSPGTTAAPAFHAPDTFGRITFSKRTSSQQALKALAAAGYEPVNDFLQLPDDVQLGPCSAVALNSKGEIHLFHRGAKPILCVDAAGKLLRSWGDDVIGMAHGMRVDRDDNVWVTDIKHHAVFKFSPTGKLLLSLGRIDQPGTDIDQFNKPTDIAFAPNGDIFVADGYGNNRVMKFDRNGKFISQWGTRGTNSGEFHLPHSIVIDSKQRVIVGDRENDRIQVFDLAGQLLEIWPGVAPYGIALDSDEQVFVADGRASQIIRLNDAGSVALRLGDKGHAPGQFELPHMLAIDSAGNIYLAEVGGERFQKLRRLNATLPTE